MKGLLETISKECKIRVEVIELHFNTREGFL